VDVARGSYEFFTDESKGFLVVINYLEDISISKRNPISLASALSEYKTPIPLCPRSSTAIVVPLPSRAAIPVQVLLLHGRTSASCRS
jgi:hypothetical protein